MTPRRPLLALAVALVAACTPPATSAGGPAPGPVESEPLVTSLQVETSADSVRFSLAVTNATNAPLTLQFPSARRYDFAVLDGAREVWRWSADRGFAQVLGTETLAPGETRTWSEAWRPDPALRGRELTAVGTLASSSHRVERRSPLRVP